MLDGGVGRPARDVELAASFAEDVCSLASDDGGGAALILKTYIDETGIQAGAPVTAVGAYFSEPQSWKVFTRLWLNTLHDFDVDAFHMNDYAQRHGAFKCWSQEKQRALGVRLFPIIPAHTKLGMAVAMIHADFDELAAEYPNIKLALGTPYTCCFHWLMAMVVERLNLPDPHWHLGCIHENNDYQHEALEAWNYIKSEKDVASRLGTLTFATKEECVPLQAADVLAWEAQKRLADQERPERKSLTALREGDKLSIQTLDRQWLHENAARLNAKATVWVRANEK